MRNLGARNLGEACHPSQCWVEGLSPCSVLRLDPEQHVFQEGDTQKFLYKVRAGLIRVYKLFGNGERKLLQFVSPGEFLGLGVKANFPFSAQAVTAAELCYISKSALQSRAEGFAPLVYRLNEALSVELEAAQDFALMVSQRDPQRRVASFLLMLSDRNKRCGTAPQAIYLSMSRRDIADHLSLTVETVSRILTKFRKCGIITIRDIRHVHIVDAAKLADMVQLDH